MERVWRTTNNELATNYMAFIKLASIRIWLRVYERRAPVGSGPSHSSTREAIRQKEKAHRIVRHAFDLVSDPRLGRRRSSLYHHLQTRTP
jgi:hypothetical protein